jgi:hypothetical protein
MVFVDLCRLCGTDTVNILRNAIFEGEGRAKKYALKISECLTLQVCKPSNFQVTAFSRLQINFLLPPVSLWLLSVIVILFTRGFRVCWYARDAGHAGVVGRGGRLNGNNELWFTFDCFLQVTEADQLPKIMCGECSYKLDLLSDFRDKAYKTETHLLSEVEVKAEVIKFLIAA